MDNSSLTWLLVADASKARIYSMHTARVFKETPHAKELALISEFTHERSRKKGTELATDKMGEFGTGTFVESIPPKLHEAELFAHELLLHLENHRKEGNYRDLIIIAPPTFMGLLNKHMPKEVHKLVSHTIDKDYTQQSERELIQNLIIHL